MATAAALASVFLVLLAAPLALAADGVLHHADRRLGMFWLTALTALLAAAIVAGGAALLLLLMIRPPGPWTGTSLALAHVRRAAGWARTDPPRCPGRKEE